MSGRRLGLFVTVALVVLLVLVAGMALGAGNGTGHVVTATDTDENVSAAGAENLRVVDFNWPATCPDGGTDGSVLNEYFDGDIAPNDDNFHLDNADGADDDPPSAGCVLRTESENATIISTPGGQLDDLHYYPQRGDTISWNHYVYRLALDDGTEEWAFETGDLVMTGPSVDADAGVVYAGSHDYHLYALDMATGDRQWAFPTDGRLIGCPTVTGEHVLVGSYDGHCYAVERETGEEAWHAFLDGDVSSTPLVADGAVYLTDRATEAYIEGDGGESGALYRLVADD